MAQTSSRNQRRGKRHPHFDSSEQEVFLQLWRTYDRLKTLEDELFGQHQLSAQQYNALRLLQSAAPDPVPTLALGRRLISRSPDMTRMIDRLEERGLIARKRRSDNRRVVEVSLTAAGKSLLADLSDAVGEMHEAQLGHLTQTKQRQLIELLKEARRPLEDETCDWLDG